MTRLKRGENGGSESCRFARIGRRATTLGLEPNIKVGCVIDDAAPELVDDEAQNHRHEAQENPSYFNKLEVVSAATFGRRAKIGKL